MIFSNNYMKPTTKTAKQRLTVISGHLFEGTQAIRPEFGNREHIKATRTYGETDLNLNFSSQPDLFATMSFCKP